MFVIEGRELARKMNCKCLEASAKLRLNVDESFHTIVREIRKYNRVRLFLTLFPTLPLSPFHPLSHLKRVNER